MAKIRIDKNDLARLRKKAREFGGDWTPAMQKAVVYLENSTRQRVAKQIDPEGNRWADLKPSTWARKTSNKIGRETGQMVNSIYSEVRSRGRIGEVISPTEYSIFFHFGTGKQPARELLGITQTNEERIAAIFNKEIKDRLE